MPLELTILVWLTLLAASLWIPYIVGVNSDPGADPDAFTRPGDLRALRPWVHRAYRAHLNLLEQYLPFAVLILLLYMVDGFTAVTAWTATLFLGLRIAHAVGMITGVAQFPLRPIIFTAGWACILVLGWAALSTG